MAESRRLASIDLVRGIVMVLMALDHVRDFFSEAHFDPTELAKHPSSALFLTRWVTHFCAPTFVFLAGVSAGIQRRRGKSPKDLGWFLLTRGLWLVVLELTVIHWGWGFSFFYEFTALQVIWVLGWSMVLLAGLQFLPTWVAGSFGLVLILGHNLLDGWHSKELGPWWSVLHELGPIYRDQGHMVLLIYPLVPWVGVMALGYAAAWIFDQPESTRRRLLFGFGGGAIVLFAILRSGNFYGDHRAFEVAGDAAYSAWSFLNTEKYPPSLLYLCMTLGPMLLALAALDRARPGERNPFLVFGRVPLFYYILHVVLIHTLQLVVAAATGGHPPTNFFEDSPWGFSLPVVYAIWLGVVATLYLPCLWFARHKARSKNPWLSYL